MLNFRRSKHLHVVNFRDNRQWGNLPLKMINKQTFDTYLTLHNLNMLTGTKNKTKQSQANTKKQNMK